MTVRARSRVRGVRFLDNYDEIATHSVERGVRR